jgi:hypothetical protein
MMTRTQTSPWRTTRSRLRNVALFSLAWLAACSPHSSARDSASTAVATADSVRGRPVTGPTTVAIVPEDTFDLVSIDGQAASAAPATEQSCALGRPLRAFYVLRPPSFYLYRSERQSGCPKSLADSINKDARYSVNGDTITTYLGDGAEEFQDGTLIRHQDSLTTRGGGDAEQLYVRRRRTSTKP